jgi:hypothetical protein
LNIQGSGFVSNSQVHIGSANLMTLYLGAQQLVAFVPPSLRSSLSSNGIVVVNSGTGGGTAGPVAVGVVVPPPVISSISPNSAAVGSQFTAVVSGQNLQNPTAVSFGTSAISATVQDGTNPSSLVLNVKVSLSAVPGSTSLTITTTSGTTTVPNAFVVTGAAVPTTAPLPIATVETGPIRVGYLIVTPDAGTSAPVTTLTFGMVSGGVVQSQAAILPSFLTTDSTLQVDVLQSAQRNLGLAMANPGATSSNVTLTLRNSDGTTVGSPYALVLTGGQQVSRFVTEIFASSNIGVAFRGSVEVQSSTPISVIGLRFSGVQFSTEPVVANSPGSVPTMNVPSGSIGGPNSLMFSQFAIGGGWATAVGLVNGTSNAMSGRIDIFDTSGAPMAVTLNGASQSTFMYSIPPRGTFTLAPRDSNGQSPF